jgi:galactokinase
MHVDSHGGWLNLMTHQREVVLAVAPESDETVTMANIDPSFGEVHFAIDEGMNNPAFSSSWLEFIMSQEIRASVKTGRGSWGNYVKGSVLSARHRFPDLPMKGMIGVVGSDLPRGAALSSSAALCIALTRAFLSLNCASLSNADLMSAARDAEWYTGSRCGLSDQAAIILGGLNAFVSYAIDPALVQTETARSISFPEELRILVINSYTERSLSGASHVDYTRNRFAYSLALEILRQELSKQNAPKEVITQMDRLSNIRPEVLAPMGGMDSLLTVLKRIPETMTISELRERYSLPELNEAYERYFGTAPENERPTSLALRGPLLFGIAESERARIFPETIQSGRFAEAGKLMTVGHDGDRRVRADGSPMHPDVGDKALDALIASGARVEFFPGAYGASTPALDALVDAALEAGAIGASLTGAGMAGAVLALCAEEDVNHVTEHVRNRLAAPDYQAISGRNSALSPSELMEATTTNVAVASANELA